MEIIKASINDVNEIAMLENKCFLHPYKKEDLIYEISKNPVSYFYIAKSNQKIVGFIDFWITFDSSTVAQICVDEAYRRNHIGTELVKFMINLLKENDVLTCTLEVRASNIIAQDFYKKLGFTNIIKKNNYYVDGEDAIYMMMEVVNV